MITLVLMSCVWVPEGAAPAPGRVVLEEQGGVVDLQRAEAELALSLRMHSELPVGVDAVELGVLYGDDALRLAQVDAGSMYSQGPRGRAEGVRAVRQTVPVDLAPRGSHRVELKVPLGGDGAPTSFQAHLLSYHLPRWTPALWRELLVSDAPSDELSAVRAFGLLGDAEVRHEARAQRQQEPGWVAALTAITDAPIPERPSMQQVRERVGAAAALAVLGETEALIRLRNNPLLSRFDEPLQVLRAAQLLGSPFDAPLAHVIPAGAEVTAEVVAWAQGLATTGDAAASDEAQGAQPPHAVANEPIDVPLEREPAPEPASPLWPWGVAAAVGLITFLVLRAFTRHREPPSGDQA